MGQQTTMFGKPKINDPCRSHHHGDPESVAAFKKGDKDKMLAIVLSDVRAQGAHGAIPDETAKRLGLALSQVAPRFTNLKFSKDIESTGEKRPTVLGSMAKVYVATVKEPQ
jgi:hypothetical protein